MARQGQGAKTTRPLPSVPVEYDQFQVDIMRRTIEQNFDQISDQIARLQNQYDRDAFLSSVANNFLFMGGGV